MPVFNGSQHLAGTIASILGQSLSDFELIVVDDGSSDGSQSIVAAHDDPRIVLIEQENRGRSGARNEGISRARGRYVACHDHDDLSMPDRLAVQAGILESNPSLGMVGCNYGVIDESGAQLWVSDLFTHPDDIAAGLIVCSQFAGPSVMIRRNALERVGSYSPDAALCDDYELFTRLARVTQVGNAPDVLYLWRDHPSGASSKQARAQAEEALAISRREFAFFRANREQYRLTRLHPRSTRGGPTAYMRKRAVLFRDLAHMYQSRGDRRGAIAMQLAACALAPRKDNARVLAGLLWPRYGVPGWWRVEPV
jgi:glycosyltransferase involved in cell wall biosynthesis